MKIIKLLTLFFLVTITSTAVFAQDESEKCEDYPMITHMTYFAISTCEKKYDELEIPVSYDDDEKNKKVEGLLFHYDYEIPDDSVPEYKISWLQLRRNFENAIKKIGGKGISDNDVIERQLKECFYLKNEAKEIYIVLQYEGDRRYILDVIEVKAMSQELDANGIFDALNKEGHIALHINFETGKSVIEQGSQKTMNDILEMLQNNPDIKISIEGHTDNVGNPAANKTLSENRAKAVMDALIAKGINKTRLSYKGWGSTKPIADNTTEE